MLGSCCVGDLNFGTLWDGTHGHVSHHPSFPLFRAVRVSSRLRYVFSVLPRTWIGLMFISLYCTALVGRGRCSVLWALDETLLWGPRLGHGGTCAFRTPSLDSFPSPRTLLLSHVGIRWFVFPTLLVASSYAMDPSCLYGGTFYRLGRGWYTTPSKGGVGLWGRVSPHHPTGGGGVWEGRVGGWILCACMVLSPKIPGLFLLRIREGPS